MTLVIRQTRACFPEFVDRETVASPPVPEGLDRHVQPDLVAKLEAVNHRLGRAVDPYDRMLDLVLLDTVGQCLP